MTHVDNETTILIDNRTGELEASSYEGSEPFLIS